MVKNKIKDATTMVSAEFSWIKNLLGFLKTFAFIGLLIAYIYYLENPDPNTASIVLYTFIGVFAVIVILDIYQLSQLVKSSYAPYLVFGVASGILFIVFLILGRILNWNWFPSIAGGMIVLYAILSLGFGKLSADISLRAIADATRKESTSQVLNRNRYYFSFLLLAIGIMLLTSGFLIDIAWYYQYLISALLIIPLVYFLIKDIRIRPLPEEEQNFLKRIEITQYIIEFVVIIAIFLLSLFVLWDLLPEGFQEIGFDNWIIFSAFLSIMIVMIIHTLLERDLIRGLFGRRSKKTIPTQVTVDGMDDLSMKEQLILIEAILITMFSFSGYYYSSALRSILLLEENIFINVLVIITSFGFFFITLACIQYYYAFYISKTIKTDIKNVKRTFYLIGFIYFILITIGSIITAFTNLVDFFQMTGIMVIIVMFVMWLDIILVPRNEEMIVQKDSNSINKIDWIFLIIGIISIISSIVLFLYIELTLTYLILNLFLLGFGVILILTPVIKLIKNQIQAKSIEKKSDSNRQNLILALIIEMGLLGFGIYIMITQDPIDDLVNFIIGVVMIAISIILIFSMLIPYMKEQAEIKKNQDNYMIYDLAFIVILIISLIVIIFMRENHINVNIAYSFLIIDGLILLYSYFKTGEKRFAIYFILSGIILIISSLYIYLETTWNIIEYLITDIIFVAISFIIIFINRKNNIEEELVSGKIEIKSDGKKRQSTQKVIVKKFDDKKTIKHKKGKTTEYIFK